MTPSDGEAEPSEPAPAPWAPRPEAEPGSAPPPPASPSAPSSAPSHPPPAPSTEHPGPPAPPDRSGSAEPQGEQWGTGPAVGPHGLPLWGPGSLAPVGLRAVARVIDTILTLIPFAIWGATAHWVRTSGDHVDVSHVPLWWPVVWQAFAVVYEAVLLSATGRTLGKWLMRERVEHGDGSRPSWERAALRAAVPGVAWVVPYFGGAILAALVYLTAVFNPLRQGIHDRAAATLVVVAARSDQRR